MHKKNCLFSSSKLSKLNAYTTSVPPILFWVNASRGSFYLGKITAIIRKKDRFSNNPEDSILIAWLLLFKAIPLFFFLNPLQEVYDWAGAMSVMPLFFTLQRRSKVVLHSHCIEGEEVLDIFERVSTFLCCMLVYLKTEKWTTYAFDLPLLKVKIFSVSSFCT